LRDPFAAQFFASQSYTQWIEPIWKMLLSNKRILPIL
jgi:glutathionylspermidine synthase